MDSTNGTDQQVVEWVRFGLKLGVYAALHPLEYSKVLIQLGYEPIPPRPGRTLFGRRALMFPNIFQYAGYIRRIDGFFGCYRGLTPRLIGNSCGQYFSKIIADRVGLGAITDDANSDSKLSEEELFNKFQNELKRDVVIHISGIVITHPFHVISLRMMAQFIGREESYTSILGSICEIYRNDGIFGFFAGIIPKLVCDLTCLLLTSSTMYLINEYINEKDGRKQFYRFADFVYSSLLYPLQVVSTCMAVTGSGLNAGKPPHMPVYNNWVDCWNDLQTRGELKRGSALFWRSVRTNAAYNKYNFAPLPTLSKYN